MTFARLGGAMVLASAIATPFAALADNSRLGVIVGGEAYDGPPRFEVTFDGEVLGQAVVAGAIDTASVGRFADAADKTPYVQAFEFDIPEFVFRPEGEVRVRLLNEAYGGEGSDRDRNIFLAAVMVNGGAVTVSGLVTATAEGFKPNQTVGEFLLLSDGNEQGVSPAPRGGWPMPLTVLPDVREARLLSDHRVDAHRLPVPGLSAFVAPEGETGRVGEALPQVLPAEVSTASVSPDCGLDQIYNVIGFNESSNELTPRLTRRLDQIIEDIGEERCRVIVTGYSSTQGDHATNALFAVERAQNVLRYLRDNGLSFRKASAVGGGATEQFGAEFSANRRVVVTVLP